jgi:hypothetical protein
MYSLEQFFDSWRACILTDFEQNHGSFDLEERLKTFIDGKRPEAIMWAMEGFFTAERDLETKTVTCHSCWLRVHYDSHKELHKILSEHDEQLTACKFFDRKTEILESQYIT